MVRARSLGLLLPLLPLLASCDSGDSKPRAQEPPAQVQQPAAPAQSPTRATDHDAEQALKLHIAENPGDAAAKIHLADYYYDKNRHREAIPMYLEALEVDPTNTSVRTDLGTCYVATEQYDQAREAYAQVMLADPTHLNSVFNMGVVENVEGNFAKAAEYWERAIPLATNPAQAQQISQMAQQARQRAADAPPGK